MKLELYVAANTPNSVRAISNLRRSCDALHVACDVEVIDVGAAPEIAEREKILAIPTLIRRSPGPEFRLIGDLSDEAQLRSVLESQ